MSQNSVPDDLILTSKLTVNPRRPDAEGFKVFQAIMDNPGITYSDLKNLFPFPIRHHLDWDINSDRIETSGPIYTPSQHKRAQQPGLQNENYMSSDTTKNLLTEWANTHLSLGQEFHISEPVKWFKEHHPKYKPSSIKTHVGSQMSVNVEGRTDNHPTVRLGNGYDLFFRLGNGNYRLWDKDNDPAPVYSRNNGRKSLEGKDAVASSDVFSSYSIDNIIAEGCFIEREQLGRILSKARSKHNLILQGAPGTGKTWLARRLAFALVGERDESRVTVMQFHPSLSYEDFVRGWRPSADGKLQLVDGAFLRAASAAAADPSHIHVVVIEEINRGNPAQIFGELLTLLENTKRKVAEAISLAYPREGEGAVHLPDNLFVIGTMNIADRSLALVDLALRRRFAFITLEPSLGPAWRKHCGNLGIGKQMAASIERKMTELNEEIAKDRALGPAFRIGHSVVTPETEVTDPNQWFEDSIASEIAPLLEEYWYDQEDKAKAAIARLRTGFAE